MVLKGDFFMARHSVEICGVNTANIKVLSILKKFVNKTDNLDDLFQVGCLGLV